MAGLPVEDFWLDRLLTDPAIVRELIKHIQVGPALRAEMLDHLNVEDGGYLGNEARDNAVKVEYLLKCVRRGGVAAYQALKTGLKTNLMRRALDILTRGEEKHFSVNSAPNSAKKSLWNSKNSQQQDYLPSKLQDKLSKKKAGLTKRIILSTLWADLQGYGVVNTQERQLIEKDKTDFQQIEALIDHIMKKQMWAFHAFLRSLAMNNQNQIVRELVPEGDIGLYEADSDEDDS